MKIHPGFVGIDISKDFLDVFNGSVGAVRRVDNRPEAIDRLIAGWAGNDVFVLFEATGHYDKALHQALSAADSAADPAREQLAELHKRRDQLVACRKQERTRLKGGGADLAASLAAHIAWLDEVVRDFDRRIATLIAEQHAQQNAQRLMHSVPGIGPVCSATLLALMLELGSRSPKAIAALAGLAPFNTDSGKFRGVRRIHGGRRRVREALYMAAVSVPRTKSRLAQAYRALREAGKPANCYSPSTPSSESSSPPTPDA